MTTSFIVPCFNEEVLIDGCLMSIVDEIERTKTVAEIIVVDNGSTDRTALIVEAWARVYFYIRLVDEPVKGVVHARQRGFEVAKYKYLANIDADNRLPRGWLTRALAEMSRSGVVAVSGPCVYQNLPRPIQALSRFFYAIAWLSHRTVGPMIQGGNYIARSDALALVSGYDTSIAFFGEDTMTAVRLATIGKIKFVLGLWIFSSSRRLEKEGLVRTTARYVINYLWITLFQRPFTPVYTDIRSGSD